MSSVVSNATPLIYLAKADRLGLVLSLFEEILIPEAVYDEVVLKGKRLSFDDFLATLEAITHHGFYLREELYLRVIREARRLTGS
jgi:hypothetical protein